MPRIHGGGNTQRGSSRSRKANGSLSGKEQVTAATNTEDDIMDVDEFDDEEFRYDGVSPRDVQQLSSDARRQRLPPKQQEFMLLEDTSSEEEEGGPDRSYKSNNNSYTTRKLSTTTKKKKSGKVNVDVDPRPKRLVPTVSSPKITLKSIARKESTNNNAKQRRNSKKGPIGKPIKTVLASSNGGGGKKSSNNDENYDNDAEAGGMKRAVSRSSGKKGGKGAASATASTKQKKNQNSVSFASDTKKKNNDCEHKYNNDGAAPTYVTNSDAPINKGEVQVVPSRAIAIDNRILPTFIADSTSRQSFFGHLPQFLEGMMEKSVLRSQQQLSCSNNRYDGEGLSIIASLVHDTASSPTTSGGHGNGKEVGGQVQQSVVPRASYLLEDKSGGMTNGERNEWLSEFLTPINHNLVNVSLNDHGDAMTGYGAKESWSVFGDLVEAIEDKLSHTNNSKQIHPYSVTLFTTDATLFAGSESTLCHIQGLEAFWKRISPAFQSNAIASVTIVIVGTKFDFGSHDFHLSLQYIDGIRKHISEMSQSMNSSSEWIFDEWNGKNLVDVQLEYIEGTDISFQCLAQKFVQESFYETYSSHVHGTISFDLPETIDGIQCKISLSLQYATLPYSIGSHETENLVNDMIRISSLSSSNVEVIQSIPLASVDSSLIYGVPMSARAGIDEDESRYNEMKMLVRQMWKYLSSSGIGLVLRLTCEEATEEGGKSPYGNDELFLLVCEEALEKPRVSSSDSRYDRSEALGVELATKTNPSCQGMLFRYASKHQMLRFVNEGEMEEAEKEEEETAEELQYQDYIERSIEMLANTGLNPLLL